MMLVYQISDEWPWKPYSHAARLGPEIERHEIRFPLMEWIWILI